MSVWVFPNIGGVGKNPKKSPWVNHIYLVTNGQVPDWLDVDNNNDVTVVTHAEIYQNSSHLPTFASPSIEVHLHRIPNLRNVSNPFNKLSYICCVT